MSTNALSHCFSYGGVKTCCTADIISKFILNKRCVRFWEHTFMLRATFNNQLFLRKLVNFYSSSE